LLLAYLYNAMFYIILLVADYQKSEEGVSGFIKNVNQSSYFSATLGTVDQISLNLHVLYCV